jgi:hypothetical protein
LSPIILTALGDDFTFLVGEYRLGLPRRIAIVVVEVDAELIARFSAR